MKSSLSQNRAAIDLHRPLSWQRQLFSYGMAGTAFLLTGIAILPLFAVLFAILHQGLPNLSWEALTSLPAPVGLEGVPNGFANAIVGTVVMVGLAALVSVPLGIMAAVYLSEFSRNSQTANLVRFLVTILSGVPSIVVGVFAYGVIVLTTRQFSAIAGSFALAVLMLPIVILATEAALTLVPQEQRLASAALGGTRFQTILKVVLRAATPGIITGVLLSIARAAGETAPLIFTALFSDNWMRSLQSPSSSMSVLIYNYAFSPYQEQNDMAWTAALVLLGVLLLINICSRLLTRIPTDP
ncbi:phosphate ABC transporter permease PstA [Egbenema bharatensis]|uniref:phosphate ABC transporter permease PstA n=1 Tax=Egbenema bharatensis TaxID=3463334 RepID=UPI003A86C79E